MGYVDLHSHVLPALDDGAESLEQSVELLTLLSTMGFDTVCATPHQKVNFFAPARDAVEVAQENVIQAIAARGLGLTLNVGAENFWDELFIERNMTLAQPRYTGERAFLFELPVPHLPPRVQETLFQHRLKGLLPVMAHPERYINFWADPDRYRAFAQTCALVVDLGALDGAHGRTECKMARWLVLEGVAHAAASDVHSAADARSAAAGIAWIRKKAGPAAVDRLLSENPRRILLGELPESP